MLQGVLISILLWNGGDAMKNHNFDFKDLLTSSIFLFALLTFVFTFSNIKFVKKAKKPKYESFKMQEDITALFA